MPEWSERVKKDGSRGDFITVWARREVDNVLYEALQRNWLREDKYKLRIQDSPLPQCGNELSQNYWEFEKYSNFMRSDHASFWYPTEKNVSFNAILLHDLGPWRDNMIDKYHSVRDNVANLKKENLLFIKNTVDSVVSTVMELANGKCYLSDKYNEYSNVRM